MRLRFLFLAPALFLFHCSHDPVIPATPEISFSSQVLPVITSNCASGGCHNGHYYEELSPLTSYSEIVALVVPGNAHKSELYKVITTLSGENAMPPQGPLTEDQIRNIYVWISQGAKNN